MAARKKTEPDLKSPCCNAVLHGSMADGVYIGSCSKCRKDVIRLGRTRGTYEWLDGESPWTEKKLRLAYQVKTRKEVKINRKAKIFYEALAVWVQKQGVLVEDYASIKIPRALAAKFPCKCMKEYGWGSFYVKRQGCRWFHTGCGTECQQPWND